MDSKSNRLSGLIERKKTIVGERLFFTNVQKHQMIEDYLSLKCSKQQIWEKYTGRKTEHGHILRWMREFGYCSQEGEENIINRSPVIKNNYLDENEAGSLDFENAQLKKRILELEDRLRREEMRAIAYSTMIDIAEKELDVSIKKNFNIKPSKR